MKKQRKRKRRRRRKPIRARIFLAEPAFITIVAAAAESYRRECYGVLLGHSFRGLTYVRAAFAYQTARRTPKSVELVRCRRRVIRSVLKAFPKYNYIGEFHSHPGYGDEAGNTAISYNDTTGMRAGEYELIIAVRKDRPSKPWQYCKDGTLSGLAGDHFIKMKAYLGEPMKKGGMRGRPVGLKCVYAVNTASSRRLLDRHKQGVGQQIFKL
jgi:proteasome lid subunit RPN8/RPN11